MKLTSVTIKHNSTERYMFAVRAYSASKKNEPMLRRISDSFFKLLEVNRDDSDLPTYIIWSWSNVETNIFIWTYDIVCWSEMFQPILCLLRG